MEAARKEEVKEAWAAQKLQKKPEDAMPGIKNIKEACPVCSCLA
jgi:hypothetical protein